LVYSPEKGDTDGKAGTEHLGENWPLCDFEIALLELEIALLDKSMLVRQVGGAPSSRATRDMELPDLHSKVRVRKTL